MTLRSLPSDRQYASDSMRTPAPRADIRDYANERHSWAKLRQYRSSYRAPSMATDPTRHNVATRNVSHRGASRVIRHHGLSAMSPTRHRADLFGVLYLLRRDARQGETSAPPCGCR
jgi:hypothetical protein